MGLLQILCVIILGQRHTALLVYRMSYWMEVMRLELGAMSAAGPSRVPNPVWKAIGTTLHLSILPGTACFEYARVLIFG